MNVFSTPAPRERPRTPDNVLAEAERILDRGATLDDSQVLYLACARPEAMGELRAKLAPWAEVWPRLPVRPLSEEATERVLAAIEHSTWAELALLDASAVCRAGPQHNEIEKRAADITTMRGSRGLFLDHHATLAAAHDDVREGLERKQADSRQHAEAAREALKSALRGGK